MKEVYVDSITGIKKSGFSSITYWTIVFSNSTIYFCKLSSNSLPGAYGAVADAFMSHKAKRQGHDLKTLLDQAKEYFEVSRDESEDYVTIKKSSLGGTVGINISESESIKLKLNNKQFRQFVELTSSES